MYKDGVVTFSDWNKGQAKHPIYGFGLLQNVEVFENKGIVGNKNGLMASGIPTASPAGMPIARIGNYTLISRYDYGELWNNTTSLATGLTNAMDMILYKDYIWVRYNNNLGAYGPLSIAPQWFPTVLTSFNANFYGKLIQGQDGYLYSTSGNEVVKLDVTAYGIPAVAPTVSVSATLDLVDGQYSTTIEEYGTKLVIGTQGSEGFYNTGREAKAKLYTWNRQAGTLGNPGLADLPVPFKEDRINAVVSHQNKLYVSAGTTGNIYMTDATNYVKIATLPYTTDTVLYGSRVYPNAMTISNHGTLLIGLSSIGSNSSSTAKFGVYEIDITDPSYPVSFRSLASGETRNINEFTVGFVRENFSALDVGWQYGSTYGMDSSLPFYIGDYAGTIETPLVKVGSYNQKKTFQHIEWSLASPLLANQSITIYYRKNSTDDWTLVRGWGNGTGGLTLEVGEVVSFADTFGAEGLEYLQLKVVLYNNNASNNIQLVNIRCW